jgi:hypothetical protein
MTKERRALPEREVAEQKGLSPPKVIKGAFI